MLRNENAKQEGQDVIWLVELANIEEYIGVTFYLETVQDEPPLGQLVVVSCEHMFNVNIQCSLS